jgi:hypothetical protein
VETKHRRPCEVGLAGLEDHPPGHEPTVGLHNEPIRLVDGDVPADQRSRCAFRGQSEAEHTVPDQVAERAFGATQTEPRPFAHGCITRGSDTERVTVVSAKILGVG